MLTKLGGALHNNISKRAIEKIRGQKVIGGSYKKLIGYIWKPPHTTHRLLKFWELGEGHYPDSYFVWLEKSDFQGNF